VPVEILATDRAGAFLVRVDGRDQSLVDLADPTRLDFDYVRRMGDVLDAVAEPGEPLRVVHVGGAGLTLPRYVAATRPRSWQVVLEPDEELTSRVREELPLPRRSGIRVRPVDGRTGLADLREGTADVVVLDAYADGLVPEELLTTGCFTAVSRVLVPGGLLLANLADRAPFAGTRDVVAGLRTVFADLAVSAEPATLRGRRAGNLLVLAAAEVPRAALRRSATTSAAPYRVLTGDEVGSSFGGGNALADEQGGWDYGD
jgi:spermidine synthase